MQLAFAFISFAYVFFPSDLFFLSQQPRILRRMYRKLQQHLSKLQRNCAGMDAGTIDRYNDLGDGIAGMF